VANRQRTVVSAAASHVDEGIVLAPLLTGRNNRGHDGTLFEQRALGRTRQVEMQAPELMHRQTLPLLLDIAAPSGHQGIDGLHAARAQARQRQDRCRGRRCTN
jgi:hypothetical protein